MYLQVILKSFIAIIIIVIKSFIVVNPFIIKRLKRS